MTAPSGKMLALRAAAILGWLALTAALGAMGAGAPLILLLDLVGMGVLLFLIARKTTVREAQSFLGPLRIGPTALTPPGVAAEWISGIGTIGTLALLAIIGIDGFALVLGMTGGLVLSSIFIAPALAASGARTLPDWVEWRFGFLARRGAVVLLAVFGILVLWIQFSFAMLLTGSVFALPPLIGVIIVGLLILLCVFGGGMGTMIAAQALLFIVLGAGVIVPAIWLGVSEAGVVLPWFAPGALLHEIGVSEGRLDIAEGFMAHDPLRAAMLGLTGLFGALALPHTLVRWPMERGAADAGYFAQRAVVLMVIVVTAIPVFAIAARAMVLMPALATVTTPDILATPSMAVAAMVRTLDPPAWLLATLGIAAVAAIVASAASAAMLVATAAVRGRAETAGGVLVRLRAAVVVAVLVAGVLALSVTVDPVAAFIALMVLAASMLLAPLAFGLFWPRATAAGAAAGVLSGGAAAIATLALNEQSLLNGAVIAGVCASGLALVLVSLTGAPSPVPPVPATKDQPLR